MDVDQTNGWFTFGKIDMEFDEFEELDLRSAVTTGLGYFFMSDEGHKLKGRASLGYQHESFMDGRSDDQGGIEVGYDYHWEIPSWLLLTHSSTFFPTFDDFTSDYRVASETAGTFPMGKSDRWKLKIGMRNEYDSMPRPDVERLDTHYFLNLIRVFD